MGTSDVKKVLAIVERIKPLLAGHPPEMQGAVLANLLSIWLAGHAPQIREQVLAFHVEGARALIEASEHELFGDAGHPGRE